MGVKGRLIASVEMKCGGHSFFDFFHTNTHHVPNISPSNVKNFEIHEGDIFKVGSIISWKYYEAGQEKYMKLLIEAADPQKKSIRSKVIEGDLVELYNYCNIVISSEHQWTIWTLEYEKKTEDTPEPLILMGVILGMTKDVEGHLFEK